MSDPLADDNQGRGPNPVSWRLRDLLWVTFCITCLVWVFMEVFP